MKRLPMLLAAMTLFLSGRLSYFSGIGEFFDRDQNKEDAKELLGESCETAGENSDNPESAVTGLALEEGSARLSDRLTSRLTSDNSKTKVTVLSQQSETSVSVSNVTALDPVDDNGVTFVQSSILYKPKRSTLNLGLGRRR